MLKTPFGIGGGCPSAAEGVTFLKIGHDQLIIGMLKLEVAFQHLYQENRQPNEISNDELAKMTRKYSSRWKSRLSMRLYYAKLIQATTLTRKNTNKLKRKTINGKR